MNNLAEHKINFGKYKGESLQYIFDNDCSYLLWIYEENAGEWDKNLHQFIEENLNDIELFAQEEGDVFF